MSLSRRRFVQGSAAAACVLALPGVASAAHTGGMDGASAAPSAPNIEKAIKASFGGGFSVRRQAQSGGLVYADIEHLGHRYMVSSSNLWDWQVVGSV